MKISVLDRKSMGMDLDFSILSSGLPNAEFEIYDETPTEKVAERIKETDIVIINKVKMTGEILKQVDKLRLICVFATGFDNIDISAAKEKRIAVCNVPAYSTESVLLLTVSTALSLLCKLPRFSEYVKNGSYTQSGVPNYLTPVFHECRGLTWGILGCGNIGSRVGEVAQSLGMRVLVHQRHPSAYENVSLETLCKNSDVISLHCPLTDLTRGLIGKEQISLMKDTCILVNEARGAVVDEAMVARALLDRKIGGYGSDVYSKEPLPVDHPLYPCRSMDNVILTPHIAWAAYEARLRCLSVIHDNIISFFNGELKNRVDI